MLSQIFTYMYVYIYIYAQKNSFCPQGSMPTILKPGNMQRTKTSVLTPVVVSSEVGQLVPNTELSLLHL